MQSAPDFAEQLDAYVADYRGPREICIRHAATLYRFYVRLYADHHLPRDARPVVNAVLAYFVVADDVIPEGTHGKMGLVDDVFLAAFGYRRLCRLVDASILENAWDHPQSLDRVMADVYKDARDGVGKKRKDILRMSGLG